MKQFLLYLFVIFMLSGFDTKAQTALEFDGVDEYVQTTYAGVLGTNPRTFQAWIYLDAAPSSNKTITDYAVNAAGSRNTFIVNGNGYLAYLSGGTNGNLSASVATVPIGEWVHVAFVYDGTNGFLYQNGEQVGTGNLTGVNTPSGETNLRIGQRVSGGSIPFEGSIDEVSVWDVALTQQEIIDYACIGEPTQFENVLTYYNFNDGNGTTLTDLAAGNDGTLMNMEEEDWVASDVCESGYSITFVVTEDDGTTPIENAEVDLDGEMKYTGANGQVVYYAYDPGTYNYTVSKVGYIDETGTVDVIDDDITIDVSLTFTGIDYDITFIVTDETGTNPLENALVDLDGMQQYTNASGETTFTGYLPGSYPYIITLDGYFPATGNIDVIDDDVTVEVSLQINDGATALEFDGVDDYVQTTYPGIFDVNPRTFQAWIYLDAAPSSTTCITDYGVNAAGSRNTFMINSSGYLGYLSGGANGGITASVATVPIGEWVHVAFVYDGDDGYLYQNGEQVGTGSLSGVDTPEGGTDYRIGQRVSGGSIPFNGNIDEVRVWDVALTHQEIIDYACIYDPSLFDNLVAYYNFNDGTGTTLTDIVGAYNGTLMNMDEEDWIASIVCAADINNIMFVVTEDDGTTPIENASVDVDGAIKYTNANGEAIFFNYDSGTYNYTISKAGYFDETGTVEVIDDDVTVEVSLTLTGINYDITFIITDETGTNPLENALVDLDGVQQYTNASGETVLTDYITGTYDYTVTKDGYFTVYGDVDVIDDDVTVEVSLMADVPTALEFDGVDDYVQTTYPGVLLYGHRTIQAWIYLSDAPTADMCITDYGGDAPGKHNTFMVNESGYLAFITDGTYANVTASIATVPIGEWAHVAFVFDGYEGFLYQNGVEVGTNILGPLNTNSGEDNFRIGERVPGESIPFKGMIDEVSVWAEALSQENIINYACIDDPALYPTLEVYYDFNDGTGTTLTDLKSGEDGTLMNMDEEDWVAADVCGSGHNIIFVVTGDDGVTPIENAMVDLDGDIKYTDIIGQAVYYSYDLGAYNYTVSKGGYFEETGTVDVVNDDVTVNLSLTLSGENYDITFIVTDELSGDPIQNALVIIEGIMQFTNEFGETVFADYLPENYDYTITKSEYYEQSGSVEVIDEDVTENVALALLIYYDITFIVTDETGTNPLEDALVDLDGVQQYTNASGETTFSEYLPEIYPYIITKDGYLPAFGNVEVVDENVTVAASLQLAAGSTALEFDGVDEYVQTSYPGIFQNAPRTFQAWIYLDAAPSSNICITDYGKNAAGSRNTFIVNSNGYLAYLSGGTNGNITATDATVPIGSWVHVAFVFDTTYGFLYQDGEQVGTGLLTGINTPAEGDNFRIGQRIIGGNIHFDGKIDQVSVWDTVLTQQQIIDYACIGDPSQYNNLVAYYNFNEGAGTILTDLVGGYNGTLLNMEEEDWVYSDVCTEGHNINFVVTEDGTTPVENATIDLDGEVKYTDENGEAVYIYYAPGTYNYTISKDGYEFEMSEVEVIDEDVLVEVELVFVSVDENLFSEINVFPNPTSGILNIRLKEETTCNIIVSDISGRVIERFIINKSNDKIDLSGVQKGMYFVKLQQGNEIVTLPLLIR